MSSEIDEVINVISGPCPVNRGAERQRYYILRKRFRYSDTQSKGVIPGSWRF